MRPVHKLLDEPVRKPLILVFRPRGTGQAPFANYHPTRLTLMKFGNRAYVIRIPLLLSLECNIRIRRTHNLRIMVEMCILQQETKGRIQTTRER